MEKQLQPQSGTGLIAAERERQVQKWPLDHDDEHVNGELVDAAISYAMASDMGGAGELYSIDCWPFAEDFKPCESRERNLIAAGALIAAELDRLRRQFKAQCNEFAEAELGFTVFDERDDYELEDLPWIGVNPQTFIREHFEEDFSRAEYDADLKRQSDEAEGEEASNA